MPIHKESNSVKCIIHRRNKILLIKRSDWSKGWTLVGGKIEKTETTEEAMRREVKEEVGLALSKVRQIGTFRLAREFVTCFEGWAHGRQSVKIDGKEVNEAHWFNLSKLPTKLGMRTKRFLTLLIR